MGNQYCNENDERIIPTTIKELVPDIEKRMRNGEKFCFWASFNKNPISFQEALKRVLANRKDHGIIKLGNKSLPYSNDTLTQLELFPEERNQIKVDIVAWINDKGEKLYNFKPL